MVRVHAVDGLHDLLHDDRVSHLPNGERAPLKEAFDAEGGAAIDELGSETCLRHALEEGRLNLLINNLTFKFAIKEGSWAVGCHFNVTLKGNLVACVAQAIEL